jgi:serine/threonine protein kinase
MLADTQSKPHTTTLDWYLLGVFTYELLTGLPPFYNSNRNSMFEAIKREKPKMPPGLSPQCKDFILRTMAKNPEERLGNKGAGEVKSHPWFQDTDWNLVMKRGLSM